MYMTIYKTDNPQGPIYIYFFFAVPRGLWDLSSPIGDRNQAPEVEAWSLNHWTAREVLQTHFLRPQKTGTKASFFARGEGRNILLCPPQGLKYLLKKIQVETSSGQSEVSGNKGQQERLRCGWKPVGKRGAWAKVREATVRRMVFTRSLTGGSDSATDHL